MQEVEIRRIQTVRRQSALHVRDSRMADNIVEAAQVGMDLTRHEMKTRYLHPIYIYIKKGKEER